MTFGQKLRQARKREGYTQHQLAEQIGAKHNSVSNWEKDQNTPSAHMLAAICRVLQTPADYFFEQQRPGMSEMEFALWDEIQQLDQDNLRDVLQFVQYIREKGKKQ